MGALNDDDDDEKVDLGKEFVKEEKIEDEFDPSDATSQDDQNAVAEASSQSETHMQMESLLMDAFSGDLSLTAEDCNLILLCKAWTSVCIQKTMIS